MTITARVENDTIKLPVHVPDGTPVEVTLLENAATPDRRAWLRELAQRRARGGTGKTGTPLQEIFDELRGEAVE